MATRKYVSIAVDLVFEGDYYNLAECIDRAQAWIDSGLYDRDDLLDVTTRCLAVHEEPIDEEEQ
jgi:hypothetical protein